MNNITLIVNNHSIRGDGLIDTLFIVTLNSFGEITDIFGVGGLRTFSRTSVVGIRAEGSALYWREIFRLVVGSLGTLI